MKKKKPAHKATTAPKDGTPASAFPELTATETPVRWHHFGDPQTTAHSGVIFKDANGDDFVIDADTWSAYRLVDVEQINENNRTAAEQAEHDAATTPKEQ